MSSVGEVCAECGGSFVATERKGDVCYGCYLGSLSFVNNFQPDLTTGSLRDTHRLAEAQGTELVPYQGEFS